MNIKKDYLDLFEWWNIQLTEDERSMLNKLYKPMGGTNDGFDAERVFQSFNYMGYDFSSASPASYLSVMSSYIPAKKNLDLKMKLLQKAESIADKFTYTDRHFIYLRYINLYNGLDGDEFKNQELYYLYSRKTVEIADLVRGEMIREGFKTLPANIGYQGVFEDLKNQGKYDEAIRLVINGREKGWNIQYLIKDIWNLVKENGWDPQKFNLKKESEYYSQAEIESDPYIHITVLTEKIQLLNKKNEPFEKEADELFEVINSSGLKNYIVLDSLVKVGSAFYLKGDRNKGIEVLNRIKTSIENISQNTIASFYAEIGKLLYSGGDIHFAYDWLKKGLDMNHKLGVKSLIRKIEKIDT